jgi:hypothetical protein
VNKAVNSEKQTVVKGPSTNKSESREPRSESNVRSLIPKEADKGRKIKTTNDTYPHPVVRRKTQCQSGLKYRAADPEVRTPITQTTIN